MVTLKGPFGHVGHKPQNQEGGNNDAVSHKQEPVLPCITLIGQTETSVRCHTVHTCMTHHLYLFSLRWGQTAKILIL